MDYKIAGHRIRIEGENLVKAVDALPGFDVFRVETEDAPVCRMIESAAPEGLREMKDDYSKIPGLDKMLYESGNEIAESCFATRKDGGYIFASFSTIEDKALLLEISENGIHTRISGDYADYLLKFGCWMAYSLAVLPYKTVAFHASTLIYDNHAVLFLGESGTGKSTHTRLWREHIEGATLLNDDSPILRVEDGKVLAYGSPWSGKMHCYIKAAYPVKAFVRLSQAPHNEIRRLGVVQAFTALHPSCPPPFAYQERLYDYVSEFLSDVLEETPVYHLECLPDADAAMLSCKTLFGK